MPNATRRTALFYATGATGAVVLGAGGWSLLQATRPTADVEAAGRGLILPVGDMAAGTQISVLFEDLPVFIRRRTVEEIAAARAEPHETLPDPQSRNDNLRNADASDRHRTIPPFEGEDQGEWLVMIGKCTRGDCVPMGDRAGNFDGWFCPCCGSHYDTAGRIRLGVAPRNMRVPRAEFVDTGLLRLITTEPPRGADLLEP